jgi:hypothetical protein
MTETGDRDQARLPTRAAWARASERQAGRHVGTGSPHDVVTTPARRQELEKNSE